MRQPRAHSSQVINMKTVASVKSLIRSFNSILWSRLGFMPVSFFEELNSPGTPETFGPVSLLLVVHLLILTVCVESDCQL